MVYSANGSSGDQGDDTAHRTHDSLRALPGRALAFPHRHQQASDGSTPCFRRAGGALTKRRDESHSGQGRQASRRFLSLETNRALGLYWAAV